MNDDKEMTVRECILELKMFRDLYCFDPVTGEKIAVSCMNESNRRLYHAVCYAIFLLSEKYGYTE